MMKIYITYILLFLAIGCAETQVLRYPPSKWLKSADEKPILMPKLKKETVQINQDDKDDSTDFSQIAKISEISTAVGNYSSIFMVSEYQEALNTNNFDEVTDSSWFTNRISRFSTDSKKLANEPTFVEDINRTKPWRILAIYTNSGTNIFLIKDHDGKTFFIKPDTKNNPEIATSASIISTRILHSIGYNVPFNRLVKINPNILQITDKTYFVESNGSLQKISNDNFKEIMKTIHIAKDGTARAVITKNIDGIHFGNFDFLGKRRADKNDTIPHEHMRELRALFVFCALLNFQDFDELNTSDVFIKTNSDLGYFKHYLTNFETTLRTDEGQKDFSIFDPNTWNVTNPNPAFLYLTKRDAFWASNIVMNLSDDLIKQIVNEAQISNPKLKKNLIDGLIKRRDLIGKNWLLRLNPLDNFVLKNENNNSIITFDDLALKYNLINDKHSIYRYSLRPVRSSKTLTNWRETSKQVIIINDEDKRNLKTNKVYVLQIQTKRSFDKWWPPSVDLLIKKNSKNEIELLGLYRRYGSH